MPASSFSVSAQELFDAAVHFGHKTHKWNPKMRNYLFGDHQGIHIFDLQKTAHALERALTYLKKLAEEGKTVLFIGTKPQVGGLLTDAAKRAGMPHVTQKWIPGLLTNYGTLSRRIRYLLQLKGEEVSGGFAKYTKKEALKLRKVIDSLEATLGGVSAMNRLPDAIFVTDVVRDRLAVLEAIKMHIPVVAVVDSNGDPDGVDYVIPGNDDSLRALEFFITHVADALVSGRKGA